MAKRQDPAPREAGLGEAAQNIAWRGEALVLSLSAALLRKAMDLGRGLQTIRDEFRSTDELLADTGGVALTASQVAGMQRVGRELVRELDAHAATAQTDAQVVVGAVMAEHAEVQVVPVPAVSPAV